MPDERKMYPELLYYRTKIKKMSVEDTTKGLKMSSATYLRCENGERELTLNEALVISNNLGVSLERLFPKIFSPKVANMSTECVKEVYSKTD